MGCLGFAYGLPRVCLKSPLGLYAHMRQAGKASCALFLCAKLVHFLTILHTFSDFKRSHLPPTKATNFSLLPSSKIGSAFTCTLQKRPRAVLVQGQKCGKLALNATEFKQSLI